ncbi:EAL domain-containing protein [Microvirga tunisiensis]|uniref:EAL domain-containing protein n=3 Tax=Pannonibacter tanglangensis TaxID=2750084 RepID=A0ABW9ZMS9_9HYPH|nr:EAL domain-containing protein [Pannonibacter sp. XCT-34]NBN78901.1 EAL domain-containing protein [Pannonibacter sp. XCT-53]
MRLRSGSALWITDSLLALGAGLLAGGISLALWRMRRLRAEASRQEAAAADALALAQHDALTGLPNRRRLEQAFPSMVHLLDPGQHRAVMMMDMDGFKPINDVYGHSFGDELLREFADRLVETVGDEGLVARLGGDEFAIVTPVLENKDAATGIARRLLNRIQEPFVVGERQVSVSTGIGIAVFPDNGYSIVELLRRADVALYRAKTSGRATFRFFEVAMDAAILHRTLLEQRLRVAISSKAIEPHFQPVLDLKSRRVVGFEALARWTDRDFGTVPPSQFIAIAEDCGLMPELTDHLLRSACEAAATWPKDQYLSFNISPVQLQDRMLPLKVLTILNQTGMDPRRLELEITENSLVRDPKTAKEILDQLSSTGIRIALDDFGTGHSSLRYLREFHIDTLKIDQSFVARMSSDEESAAIIRAILGLSRGLGIETVAEGIEQRDQIEALNTQGCRFGQGFLFSAAVPASDVNRLMQALGVSAASGDAGVPSRQASLS